MTPEQFLVGGSLSGWIAATIALQFPNPVRRLLWLTPLPLVIPDWRLFAPRPIDRDYVLVARSIDSDGRAADWVELVGPPARSPSHALFNPQGRRVKALADARNSIAEFARELPGYPLAEAPGYRALVRYVSARLPEAKTVQFAVVETVDGQMGEEMRLALLSAEHNVSGD